MPPLNSSLNYPLGQQTQALIDSINSQISTINSQISALQSSVTALQNRMTTAETNITNNANAITALTTRVSTAETNITSLQARMTTAETNITNNSNAITTLQANVGKNTTDITALTGRVGTNEANITSLFAHDSTQDQSLSDLDHRVTALEQGGSVSPGGPFIGDLVHVRDNAGHCQPAVVYEDWDGRNGVGIISIAVLSPIRLSESPWDSYIEVTPDKPNSLPFTTWHWPEMAFQYRRNLFLKVAAHATHSS